MEFVIDHTLHSSRISLGNVIKNSSIGIRNQQVVKLKGCVNGSRCISGSPTEAELRLQCKTSSSTGARAIAETLQERALAFPKQTAESNSWQHSVSPGAHFERGSTRKSHRTFTFQHFYE